MLRSEFWKFASWKYIQRRDMKSSSHLQQVNMLLLCFFELCYPDDSLRQLLLFNHKQRGSQWRVPHSPFFFGPFFWESSSPFFSSPESSDLAFRFSLLSSMISLFSFDSFLVVTVAFLWPWGEGAMRQLVRCCLSVLRLIYKGKKGREILNSSQEWLATSFFHVKNHFAFVTTCTRLNSRSRRKR